MKDGEQRPQKKIELFKVRLRHEYFVNKYLHQVRGTRSKILNKTANTRLTVIKGQAGFNLAKSFLNSLFFAGTRLSLIHI